MQTCDHTVDTSLKNQIHEYTNTHKWLANNVRKTKLNWLWRRKCQQQNANNNQEEEKNEVFSTWAIRQENYCICF